MVLARRMRINLNTAETRKSSKVQPPVQCDLQHDFAWVTDEADRSVVLSLLQVAFLGKFDD